MSKQNFLTILLTGVTFLVISSCNKDDDLFSFVDGYDAPLTEEEGVVHDGNFFPFIEANYWKYSGHESVTGEMTINYQGEKDTESLDDDYSASSTLTVNAPQSISLSSGTYKLYPVRESLTADYNTTYTTRYFEKASDAIYLRAIKLGYDNIVEVKNPVYLKVPLVVGDKWEAQPEIDMESLMEGSLDISGDISMDMKCVMYVIGKEEINWKGDNVETIRLDERAQAKATINVEEDGVKGSMLLDMQITLSLNYLEGVGLISQESNISLTITGSFSGEGEKITLKMDMDTEGSYILSSYSFNGEKSAEIENFNNENNFENSLPKLSDNPVIQRKLEEVIIIIKKLVL